MRISLNTSKLYDNIWASFIFFTRLPFWRLHEPPKESYRYCGFEHWPLTGWLTGGIMAAVIYFWRNDSAAYNSRTYGYRGKTSDNGSLT